MKKGYIYIIFMISLVLFTACNKAKKEEPINVDKVEEDKLIEEVVDEIEELIVSGIPSPLSGLYAEEEKVNRRVVAAMFDNHPSARWQAGLKEAELIYEFQVEAPYTRYLGLFLINEPKSIGPIRSSRPYFVTKALEYDAVYVRVGGSEQAKSDIKSLKIADIDGLTSSNKVFWRSKSKKAPHNLYTSMEVIRSTQEERGFKMTGDTPAFIFNEKDTDIEGFDASSILIDYKGKNTTKYIYDIENKIYLREKDGSRHIDESDNTQLTTKNIIIQEVVTKVIDKEGRLDINLVGEGKARYFTNGKGMEIKWSKDDRKSRTIYYTLDGQELKLNAGITWVQMVNPKMDIIINDIE